MEMHIDLHGKFADEEIRSLYSWLQREPDIRRNARMALGSKNPSQGQMGEALDLITLVVASGLALPNFIQTLLSWRKTRRQECTITLTIDGITTIIEGAEQRTAVEIAADLVRRDAE